VNGMLWRVTVVNLSSVDTLTIVIGQRKSLLNVAQVIVIFYAVTGSGKLRR
jgi:hypothetical protein